MIYGLKGIVTKQTPTVIVLDVNGVYYEVKVPVLDEQEKGTELFLYTYQVIREDEHYLVGFKTLEEKDLFMSLLNVSGIGPKTALGIMSATTPARFYQAIASEELSYLKKLPGVGPKGASQIILDLKGKLQTDTSKGLNPYEAEVKLGLQSLGFKVSEINKVLKKVSAPNLDANTLFRLALSELRR